MRLHIKWIVLLLSVLVSFALGFYFISGDKPPLSTVPFKAESSTQGNGGSGTSPTVQVNQPERQHEVGSRSEYDDPNAYDDDPMAFAPPGYKDEAEAEIARVRALIHQINDQHAKGEISKAEVDRQMKAIFAAHYKDRNTVSIPD